MERSGGSLASEMSGSQVRQVKDERGKTKDKQNESLKNTNERDKGEQSGRPRQDGYPLSTAQPALQIYQIISPLSGPGDRPFRPLAQGPGRSGYINT